MKINKTKTKQNTICVGHHYTQTNTNNVNEYMQNQCLTHMLQEGQAVPTHVLLKLNTIVNI